METGKLMRGRETQRHEQVYSFESADMLRSVCSSQGTFLESLYPLVTYDNFLEFCRLWLPDSFFQGVMFLKRISTSVHVPFAVYHQR